MAFAVEPYILVDILLSKSSVPKLGGFNLRGERQQDIHVRCIYSLLTLAQCVHISSGVGVCVAYSCEWAAKALSSG